MGKKLLCIMTMLLLVVGCAQGENENQGIAGKFAFDRNISDILDSVKDTSKKEEKKSDEEEASNSTENTKEEKQTADYSQSTSDKQSTEKKSTSKQIDSSTSSSQGNSSNDSNQQSSSSTSQELPKQDTSKPQDKEPAKPVEPTKPVEPAQPEPTVPSCDDTIPAGAYPVSREQEICSQIQAEMIKNLNEGKPTFERYEVEYGYTGCGTHYFYIIYK